MAPARFFSQSTEVWVASSTVIAGIPIEASHPSTDLLITTLPLVWVEVAVGGVVESPIVAEGGLVAEKNPVGSKKYAPTPKTSTAAAPAIIILYIEKIVRRI